jgi:hypothetical protein
MAMVCRSEEVGGLLTNPLGVRMLSIEVKAESLEGQELSWKEKCEDERAPEFVRELLKLVYDGKARVTLDSSVDILEVGTCYVLDSTEANVTYAVEAELESVIKEWHEPIGTRLLAKASFYTINGEKKLGVNFFYEKSFVSKREVFKPMPILEIGVPKVKHQTVAEVGERLVDGSEDFVVMSAGGSSDVVMFNIIKITQR